MTFAFEEMKAALERVGYSVVLEEEIKTETYYHRTEETPVKVYNVYLQGKKYCEWSGFGTRRVQETFDQELRRRMLLLFI